MAVLQDLKSGIVAVSERLHNNHDAEQEPYAGISVPNPGRSPLPWRRVVRQALAIWLATRIGYLVFTYFTVIFNAQGPGGGVTTTQFPPSALLSSWNQWDVAWYTRIASEGYSNAQATAFFPLFPFLTHLLGTVIGSGNMVASAMIVSNLATLGTFVVIGLLAASEYGEHTSSYAMRAAAAYPMAFFMVAGYSDSVFLLCCASTLLSARRGWWHGAAVSTFLASVARPVAVVLVLPLLWEYARQHRDLWAHPRGWRQLNVLVEVAEVMAALPLGIAWWGVYLWRKFGDPLLWVKAQRQGWDHQTIPPWDTWQLAVHTLQTSSPWGFIQARTLLDLGFFGLFALLTLLAIRRMPVMLTLYMGGVIFILSTSAVPGDFRDPFMADARYLLMSAPIFMILGAWMTRRPWLDVTVVGVGFMLQGMLAAFWLRGGWIV